MAHSASESDEEITKATVTRAGRISKPVSKYDDKIEFERVHTPTELDKKYEEFLAKMETYEGHAAGSSGAAGNRGTAGSSGAGLGGLGGSRADHNTRGDGNTDEATFMAQMAQTNAKLVEMVKTPKSTTIISGDSLPVFRGRRRPCDAPFEEKTTFSRHVTSLKAHMASLADCTEEDKKQLLIRSADPALGDFHIAVNELANNRALADITFDEMVSILQDAYVSEDAKNIHALCKDLYNTRLTYGGSFTVDAMAIFQKIAELTHHLVTDDKVNMADMIPGIDVRDTPQDYHKKMINFYMDLATHAIAWVLVGPQLCSDIRNKTLGTPMCPAKQLLAKIMAEWRAKEKKDALKNTGQVVTETHYVEEGSHENETEAFWANTAQPQRGAPGTYGRFRRSHTRVPQRGTGRGTSPNVSTRGSFIPGGEVSNRGNSGPRRGAAGRGNNSRCFICNRAGHFAKACPYAGKWCEHHQTRGHTTQECRAGGGSQRTQEVKVVETATIQEQADFQ